MLQAVAAHLVAERDQEVVVVVVVRAVHLVHLLHQIAERLDLFRLGFQVLRRVGDDVHVHRRLRARIEIDALEILARVDRRIDQVVVVDRLEVDRVAIPRGHVQCRAGLPAHRQFHAGFGLDLAGVVAGRIQRHGIPLQVEHLRGHHHAALAAILRREVLERHVHAARALRHVDMEGVHVERIARPRQHLAIGLDHQSGHLVDRTGRRMVAGKPLRVKQGERAGGGDRHGLVHAEDPVRHVGGVHGDLQCALVRHILRRRDIGKRGKTGQAEAGGDEGGSEAGDFQCVLRMEKGEPGERCRACRKITT